MKRLLLTATASIVLLSGCSSYSEHVPYFLTPYRPDVHQGNVVTSEMVDSLHEGMTKNQVLFLLGNPTLKSVFHANEWDYPYYLNPRRGSVQLRKLAIVFGEDGRVESIKADEMPSETDADLMILGERARESTLQQRKAQLQQGGFNATDDGKPLNSDEVPENPEVHPVSHSSEAVEKDEIRDLDSSSSAQTPSTEADSTETSSNEEEKPPVKAEF